MGHLIPLLDSVVNHLALETGQRMISKTTQQLCRTPPLCLPCWFALGEADLCRRSQESLCFGTLPAVGQASGFVLTAAQPPLH